MAVNERAKETIGNVKGDKYQLVTERKIRRTAKDKKYRFLMIIRNRDVQGWLVIERKREGALFEKK